MIDAIQKLVPWLIALPMVPKAFVTLLIVAIAGFSITILWLPQASAAVTRNEPHPPAQEITMDDVKQRLDHLSETNAKILKAVAEADQYGIYVGQLSTKLSIPRDELIYRGKDLQAGGLVEILNLTDVNFRLHDDVKKALGANANQFILAYLK